MRLDRAVFVKLMLGTFLLLLSGFFVRGLSTVVVGADTAQVVAAPVFVAAVGLAIIAFILALLVQLGLVDDTEIGEESGR